MKKIIAAETAGYGIKKALKIMLLAGGLSLSPQLFAKTYVVGTISSFPPFAIANDKGLAEGFDIEVLNAIAKKENFELTYIISPWNGLLDKLNSGERDIVATGVVITPEREEKYDFSEPYLDTQWTALLKAGPNGERYNSFAEAVEKSNRFTTQRGGAAEEQLRELIAKKGSGEFLPVDHVYFEVREVAGGRTDMSYDISRVLQYYANVHKIGQKYHLYTLIDPDSKKENFGFVVKKGRNDGLRESLNRGLEAIKADGTFQEIYKKWYGDN